MNSFVNEAFEDGNDEKMENNNNTTAEWEEETDDVFDDTNMTRLNIGNRKDAGSGRDRKVSQICAKVKIRIKNICRSSKNICDSCRWASRTDGSRTWWRSARASWPSPT